MRTCSAVVAVLLVLLVAKPRALAQEPGRAPPSQSLLQQERVIDEQLRNERQRLAPVNSLLDFQYGGWVDYYFMHFDDGLQRSRLFQRPSMAVWSSSGLLVASAVIW